MNARTVALVIAALAGLATLGWKSAPDNKSWFATAQVSDTDDIAWDGSGDFCVGLHRELSVAKVQIDESQVRGYIVALVLNHRYGEKSPAYSFEKQRTS